LKRTSPKSSIDYDLIAKADKNRQRFHTIITNALQKKPYHAKLAKTIVGAAKEKAGVEKKVRQDWFKKKQERITPCN
jgi:hypothetical protein